VLIDIVLFAVGLVIVVSTLLSAVPPSSSRTAGPFD
jgi:hypothetical protein